MSKQDPQRKIFTLTKLNEALERHFMQEFGVKSFWVTAEIVKINQKGGNYYLELADSVNGIKTAQMSAYIWSMQFQELAKSLGEEIKTILVAGNKVLFQLKIEFHKVYGLKLNIVNVDPTYSYGEIERIKKENIETLKKEGLFELQKELNLSILAKRIAVIGSPDTSGYRDFMDTLFKNNAYRNFKVKVFPSSVQGERAVPELIKAIQSAEKYDVDVIVMVRGGGGKMDLHVFNDLELCRAICRARVPVLTGIGHESDEVVADLVANTFTITPTAAAKFLFMRIYTFSKDLFEYFDAVKGLSFFQMSNAMDEFRHAHNYLVLYARELLNSSKHLLQQRSHDVQRGLLQLLSQERNELFLRLDRIASLSLNKIQLTKDVELVNRMERVELLAINSVERNRVEINNLEELFHLLNPEKLLKSGYTISTIEDKDLLELSDYLIGKEMKTLTTHSLVTSKIIKQEKLNKNE
jgi:exodeoxyribonuclease VII large subunit